MDLRPPGRPLAVPALLACLSCTAFDEEVQSDPRELWSEEDVVAERTFLPAVMDSLWSIGGTEADTLLLNPYWLSAGAEGVTLWDGGRNAVIRISGEGEVLWTFGREGGGPGEFRTVRGIAQLPDGGAAVVDNVNERLTIIDRDGRLAGETNLSGLAPESVASLYDGGLVVLTRSDDPAFLVADENGVVVDSMGFPSRPYRDLSPMARQGRVIGAGAGWVFGFTVGNGWWRIGGGRDAEGFPYAEHADFPGIETSVGEAVVGGRTVTTRSTRTTEFVSTANGLRGARGYPVRSLLRGEQRARVPARSLQPGERLVPGFGAVACLGPLRCDRTRRDLHAGRRPVSGSHRIPDDRRRGSRPIARRDGSGERRTPARGRKLP